MGIVKTPFECELSASADEGRVAHLLGATLQRIREKKRWSQALLARAAGVSPDHLSDIENGRCPVSVDWLMRVLRALETHPRQFFLHEQLKSLRQGARSGPRPRDSRKPNVADLAHFPYLQLMGERLRFERNRRLTKDGLTQQELASRVGIPASHLSRIECGRARPSVTLILSLLKIMAIDPAKFFGEVSLPFAHSETPRF